MNKSPIYDPAKRRCVVHSVLKDYFNNEQHMKALWILEDTYSKQHSLPILEFIDDLEKLVPLGDRKKQLRERLTKELYFSERVGEDPWDEMMRFKRISQVVLRKTPPRQEPPDPVAAVEYEYESESLNTRDDVPVLTDIISNELRIFSRLMREINSRLTKLLQSRIQKFYSELIFQLPTLSITPEAEASITAWCHHNGQLEFQDLFSVPEMSSIVHTAYVWCCEALGPDDTDQMFAQAVHEVERLPEALHFHPTELL